MGFPASILFRKRRVHIIRGTIHIEKHFAASVAIDHFDYVIVFFPGTRNWCLGVDYTWS